VLVQEGKTPIFETLLGFNRSSLTSLLLDRGANIEVRAHEDDDDDDDDDNDDDGDDVEDMEEGKKEEKEDAVWTMMTMTMTMMMTLDVGVSVPGRAGADAAAVRDRA
jgi:preprotein translocase subunit SecD